MAVKKVPEHWLLTCDGCGETKEQTNSGRPSGWAYLTFEQGALDSQACEVADATVKAMFCGSCRPKIAAAINDAKSALTAPFGEGGGGETP